MSDQWQTSIAAYGWSRRVVGTLAVGALVTIASGCGDSASPDGQNYGNLLASPAGLIVVEEEHPSGWGRADCFLCHEIRSMHVVNRTDLPDCDDVEDPETEPCIDLEFIQSVIRDGGEESCMLCHGTNGVEE